MNALDLKNTVIGIEFGSTRIKAVLVGRQHEVIASGSHEWQNSFAGGVWTYPMKEIHEGMRSCFRALKEDVRNRYHIELTVSGAIGISGMMHGYLPFDREGNQLAEFRTWRNTITGAAAAQLTEKFGFNIPQRWSAAHLYQAILNDEPHVKDISYLTTLAGYIHWKLTGKKVMGVGEASGMFPIAESGRDYDEEMVRCFDRLIEGKGYPWKLRDILPEVLCAGECGGTLTEEGARFLDPEGVLQAGIPVAPCEGDAGTGMTATNSVRVHTGNVSAGTSDFAMVVTDHPLGVHREIDMVTTPSGAPVAMVHCSNCTSDINAWIGLFAEFAEEFGFDIDRNTLFTKMFRKALEGDSDCGGLLSYNYYSGEGVTDLDEGRPVFARMPDARFTLANFMRTNLLSALATLKIGLDILTGTENVTISRLYGHGGFFKTPDAGQRMLSAACGTPVSVMKTAGEGGPYGMALLCAYMIWKDEGETLEDYLDSRVFKDSESVTVTADESDIRGFDRFLEQYKKGLDIERAAIRTMRQDD